MREGAGGEGNPLTADGPPGAATFDTNVSTLFDFVGASYSSQFKRSHDSWVFGIIHGPVKTHDVIQLFT